MPIPPLPEHKIEVFVLFWPSGPPFSSISSTKSAFLCAFEVRNPQFLAFRAQNRGFCALLPSETLVFGLFEHKIRVFVRFCQQVFPDYGFYGLPCQQHLPDGYPPQRPGLLLPDGYPPQRRQSLASAPWPATVFRWRSATAAPLTRRFATAPRPATNLIRRRKVLRFG